MAANTKDTVVTGKLADQLVAKAREMGTEDGTLEAGVSICETRVTRVWSNTYRVSLYTKYLPPNNFVVPDYKIVSSYLLGCESVDGVIIDKTVRKPQLPE